MTNATRDITKLNFITDQGSIRATVRCACRAGRFAAFFRGVLLAGAAARLAAASAGPTAAAGADGTPWAVASALERRKFRAGDVGDVGGESGTSQANAAAETAVGDGSGRDEMVGEEASAAGSVTDAG